MSTSTLGREERKPILDAFLLQRRLLLGCTCLIGISSIIWIVAVATDYWFYVDGHEGIYIPETRRYFMSSHMGIWRVCRNVLVPLLLANSSAARDFTTIALTNATQITEFKKKVARLNFVTNLIDDPLSPNITEFNDNFKQHLFGHWLRDDKEFKELKKTYKHLEAVNEASGVTVQRKGNTMLLDSTNVSALMEAVGNSMATVTVNRTTITIIMPEKLRSVMFDGWERNTDVVYLLWSYAKDLEIPIVVTSASGSKIHIKPPPPPKDGKIGNGYEYIPVEKCKNLEMIQTDESPTEDHDEELMDYRRTAATFSCICVFVMFMGFFFSLYTFLNPRYMFKRLAGGIHFISGISSLVVVQVAGAAINYQEQHPSYSFPKGATQADLIDYYLAWIVVSVNFIGTIMFMWYSKKKKGSKALTEEMGMADEPVVIGR